MENINELKINIHEIIEMFSFSINEFAYYSENFGNIVLTIKKNGFLIRFVRDRGDLYVELGTLEKKDEWINLQTILKLLYGYDYILWRDDILNFVKYILEIENEHHNELNYYCNEKEFTQLKEDVYSYQLENSPFRD